MTQRIPTNGHSFTQFKKLYHGDFPIYIETFVRRIIHVSCLYSRFGFVCLTIENILFQFTFSPTKRYVIFWNFESFFFSSSIL
jgi:hypothetical protein